LWHAVVFDVLPAVVFRESVYVGDTDLSQDEVHQIIVKMGQEFKGNKCVGLGGVHGLVISFSRPLIGTCSNSTCA
jgi:hypothetical protein